MKSSHSQTFGVPFHYTIIAIGLCALLLPLGGTATSWARQQSGSDQNPCGGANSGGIAFSTNTHAAVTHVALTNQLSTIDTFLRQELLFNEGLMRMATNPASGERSLLEWAKEGSIREDDTIPSAPPIARYRHHFHDPITDQGLQWVLDGHDAIVWATSHPSNDYNLVRISSFYWCSLTAPTPHDRETCTAYTFEGIGHFMHLIEDMAQPAHTRNDPHPDDAFLEYYAASNFGTPELLGILLDTVDGNGTSPPAAPPYFTLNEPLPGHLRYRHFFDTDQYTGQAVFAGFATPPGLAEYSNFGFFSEDTVYSATYPHPTYGDTDFGVLFPFPAGSFKLVHKDGLTGALNPYLRKTGQATLGIDSGYTLCSAKNTGQNPIRAYFFPNSTPIRIEVSQSGGALYDYCQKLLPKAIAYSTDFANFFFRGRLGVNLVANPQTGNLELTITNLSLGTLTQGGWRLMQDDESGLRVEVGVDWSSYPGTLAQSQSFMVAFQPAIWTRGDYTLVFKAQGAPNDDYTIEVLAKNFSVPLGACCLSYSCSIFQQQACEASGGTFVGAGTTCESACAGACCISGGCQIVMQPQCNNIGGSFQGTGTTCEATCPGACCLTSGCQIILADACTAAGGTFQGYGTTCWDCPTGHPCVYRLVDCPHACPHPPGDQFLLCDSAHAAGLGPGSEIRNGGAGARCVRLESHTGPVYGTVVSLYLGWTTIACDACTAGCPINCGTSGNNCPATLTVDVPSMTVQGCGNSCEVQPFSRTLTRYGNTCWWNIGCQDETAPCLLPLGSCTTPNPARSITAVVLDNGIGLSCVSGKWRLGFVVNVYADGGCNCYATLVGYESSSPVQCDSCPATGEYLLITAPNICVNPPPSVTVH